MIVDAYLPAAQAQAIALLTRGDLVAIPTETVYGLAADASQATAVAKIFALKQRPTSNPLIVHIGSMAQLNDWAVHVPHLAYRLAAAFWPGPMTLILKKAPWVPRCVTAGQETIALRIPNHPAALALLKQFNGGVAAPSANLYTQLSPTTAQHVEHSLGSELLILDGGPAQIGIESTIIDCSSGEVSILRPGMLSAEMISTVLGQRVNYHAASEIKRPGSHYLHYAPQADCQLLTHERLATEWSVMDLATTGFITYSCDIAWSSAAKVQRLSSHPAEYARDLYRALHHLDQQRCARILVELPPTTVAWYAVHERLHKAAGLSLG